MDMGNYGEEKTHIKTRLWTLDTVHVETTRHSSGVGQARLVNVTPEHRPLVSGSKASHC